MITLQQPFGDCSELLAASQQVIRLLTVGGDPESALTRSMNHLARGLDADVALLLLVEREEPFTCQPLFYRGLDEEQVRRCEYGEVVGLVDPSTTRSAVSERRTQWGTTQRPVVCVPVPDPAGDHTSAVIVLHTRRRCPHVYSRDRQPAWLEEYAACVGHAFAYYFDKRRRARLEERSSPRGTADGPELIGDSPQTHGLRQQLQEVYVPASDAPDPDPVLILGEKGTGKDVVARYLHAHSKRRDRPLVVVNCAEISDELSPSRFFGHRKGSFTGAINDEAGFFRAAHKGVLFLDEIGELSLRAQATLLRVLENRTVVPIGDTREIPVDVQVVLATNRDPARAVDQGVLKSDFVDRFRTQSIHVEPLRHRVRDIPPLVRHFQAFHERRTAKRTQGFTPEALKALLAYGWPGNVRELSRVCSLLLTHVPVGAPVDRDLLTRCYPDAAKPTNAAASLVWEGAPMRTALRAFQRELILARLEEHGWNTRAARESLRLPKTTFQRCLAHLQIAIPGNTAPAHDDDGESD